MANLRTWFIEPYRAPYHFDLWNRLLRPVPRPHRLIEGFLNSPRAMPKTSGLDRKSTHIKSRIGSFARLCVWGLWSERH